MGATGYIIKGHNGGRGGEARKEVVVSAADGTIDVEKVETFDKVDFRIKTTYDGYETINVGSPASGGYFKAAHIKFNEENRRYRLVCILNGGSYTPVAKDFAIYYIKFGWRTGGVNADHWYIEEYSRQGNGAYVSLEQIALNEYNVLIHTPTGYAYANIGILKEDKEPDVTIDHFNNNTTRYTPTGTIIETETPAWKNGALVDTNPEDLEIRNGLLQLADRSSINGLGYIILRPDKTFAEQVTQSNCIYEVRYNFDLGGTEVTIPSNCVIKFEGGSLTNGTLVGNDTEFLNLTSDCLLVDFKGSFINTTINAEFVGLHPNDTENNQTNFDRLSNLINCIENITIVFSKGTYLFGGSQRTKQPDFPNPGIRGCYNLSAICIPTTTRNITLSIIGSDTLFKSSGVRYAGAFNYVDGEYIPDYDAENVASKWSNGNCFIAESAAIQSHNFYMENCTIDGDLEGFTFGGNQNGTMQHTGLRLSATGYRKIVSCTFKNHITDGISFGKGSVELYNCKFINNIRWGFSSSRLENLICDACVFEKSGNKYDVNSYYVFEGNNGAIDLEASASVGMGDIVIKNSTFIDTNGESIIVSANGNIESFLCDNCIFSNSFNYSKYISSTHPILIGRTGQMASTTRAFHIFGVKGSCVVTNCTFTNIILGTLLKGQIPTSTEIPTTEDEYSYIKDPYSHFYAYGDNLTFNLNRNIDIPVPQTPYTRPVEGFSICNEPVSYVWDTSSSKWVKQISLDAPYDIYYYGAVHLGLVIVNLIANTSIGDNNAAWKGVHCHSVIDKLIVNVKEPSSYTYFRYFKDFNPIYNKDENLSIKELVINDFNTKEETIFKETIKRNKWDGYVTYNQYGTNKGIDIEKAGNMLDKNAAIPTSERPVLSEEEAGFRCFDTDLNKPIYWTGSKWVDANGNDLQ